MTTDQLIDTYNKIKSQIRKEDNLRHKELLKKVAALYKEYIKKDISDAAEREMNEWIKESLKDF